MPEYRRIRASAPTFLEFCYNPQLAAEATLQPIRRFELDAAILFSDILVIPDALGQRVSFEAGEGPRLEPIDATLGSIQSNLRLSKLDPVFETIGRAKRELGDIPLIGFCGAPWTVATYMVAGRGSSDQQAARLFAYQQSEAFENLIAILIDASVAYLVRQVEAGVNVLQIFDSWAGVLPTEECKRWCIKPLQRIVSGVRNSCPNIPIIAFPRGAASHLGKFREIEGVNAIGLDTSIDPRWAVEALPGLALQGNLDPLALVAGGKSLDQSIDQCMGAFRGTPHILNLGHGVVPETPVENVERLVARVRGKSQ